MFFFDVFSCLVCMNIGENLMLCCVFLMCVVKKRLRRRFTMCRARGTLVLDVRSMRRPLINSKVGVCANLLFYLLICCYLSYSLCDWLLI